MSLQPAHGLATETITADLPQIPPTLRMVSAAEQSGGRYAGGAGGELRAQQEGTGGVGRGGYCSGSVGVSGSRPGSSRSVFAAALRRADSYSLCLGSGLAWELCRAGALRCFCAKNNDNGRMNFCQYSCGSASGG